ncbi:hypothetical protein RHSP_18548 [Rhizobium freirei PRF 81]|uniref:Uncharacterized protein n=1 Tax=Rhizobium freirei PRF 81 TaxID=363754 RepID=N6UVU0_9HYPH|nr:hypothetical protein RHSP_18548 [Rhizobium freirei PRF 81]
MRQKTGPEDKAEPAQGSDLDRSDVTAMHRGDAHNHGNIRERRAGLPKNRSRFRSYALLLSLITAQDKRGVRAAEAEGVRQRDIDFALACLVRNEIDGGVTLGIIEVERRRGDVVANGERRKDRLDRTGSAEQVAGRRLGGRHRDPRSRIADQTLDCAKLDRIRHGRGAVGVDIVQVCRGQAGALQRGGHAAERAFAILGRSGDMVRVAREAVADHFGVDLGAARLGVFQLLQNDDTGALAHDEAVTVTVIGTRSFLRRVVKVRRQRLAGGKARERDTADRCFGATGDHHIGVAEHDQAGSIANGVGTGRACGDDRMVRAAQLVADRDLAGNQVDETARDKERRDAARTLVAQRIAGFDDAFEAADARADHDARGDLILIRFRVPVCIGERHVRCRHAIDDEGIDLALLLRLHPVVSMERAVGAIANRNTAGNLCREIFDLEFGHAARAIVPSEQTRPGHLGAAAQR